ncbi:LLM class flavin-dependent oxidoreductase [Lacisediminihabitans profunda]|uniref:LLM class flavin-dependent oxidoreductase n=1 Tax=Lacisediminihabitans profunda TaxID=2594790 RepID=A0A5C8USZ2_9MICO|nr:LLM class flavin-dependent oxidoreductase [Lacisediminihabitans profunda]TXN30648.1 LLM class flavin-dependent oxidoreductase [Lacisediminihabitans profunda]
MKRIGFLSFGHWQPVPGSETRTARDALLQTVELAVAAEEIGIDGAYVRVHHFAPQLASPFPLLAAMAARTSRIEVGTGVIDMRYENPLYMAEEAAVTDLLSGGRLQLGVSRGSPETALRGSEAFGYVPADGRTDSDDARTHTALFRAAIDGAGVAMANPQVTGTSGALAIQPQSPGLADRIWWGSGTRQTARWTAEQGMNLMSSTLLTEDTGVPFDELQAEQIAIFRAAWAEAGWQREPRVSVSRSVLPIVTDLDRRYFGGRSAENTDQVGYLDGGVARFGKSYVGEPDAIADELSRDAAVREADTVLLTVPNQLGVDYNAHLLETIARHVAPALGWRPNLD